MKKDLSMEARLLIAFVLMGLALARGVMKRANGE